MIDFGWDKIMNVYKYTLELRVNTILTGFYCRMLYAMTYPVYYIVSFTIMTISIIIQETDTKFNLPEKVLYDEEGWPQTEAGKYLGDLRSWFSSLSDAPETDAVMVFTGLVTFLFFFLRKSLLYI